MKMITSKITAIGAGPFLGDFRTEILHFRPHVFWLQSYVEYKDAFYVNSHFNRDFLYENVEFMPVYEYLSRDELSQKTVIHKDIQHKDYQLLQKDFKKTISKKHDCKMSDIFTFSLPYNDSGVKAYVHQKKYTPINFTQLEIEEQNFVLFIPDNRENVKRVNDIYEKLSLDYKNVIVIGDFRTHLLEKNVLFKKPDYMRNSLLWILSYIQKADVVVCPAGFWTALSNLQSRPVISWGFQPGRYRDGGEFYFNNILSQVFSCDKDTPADRIYKMLEYNMSKIV